VYCYIRRNAKHGRRAGKSCALSNQISSIMTPKRKKPASSPMRFSNRSTRGVAAVGIVAIMGGCANEDSLSPYAEPSRYDLDCTSIAERITKASDRERQLAQLMTRASEAVDGAIVNAIAYQDEYNTARANLRSLRKAAEVKKCQSP
jgi:hypothetical protein